MKEPNFQANQWIAWIGATLVAAGTLTAFAYQNFATKDEVKENKGEIIHRLDKIDDKLDKIKDELSGR